MKTLKSATEINWPLEQFFLTVGQENLVTKNTLLRIVIFEVK